jgi:tRNA threonylcarbamoyladenosine biosynthesis protein TsaB
MRILALETSGKSGSVAAAEGPRIVGQLALNPNQRSAQSLAFGVGKLLDDIGWSIREIELVAVTKGPGSFTGLRVGVVTAKTLAYALGARVIGLNTLEVIAAQAPCDAQRLSVAIDAQRGAVFAATFAVKAQFDWQVIGGDPRLLDDDEWLGQLGAGMTASGPALSRLAGRLPMGVALVDEQDRAPRADAVAALAWVRHLQGAYDDVWRLAPLYLRKSAAEEKLGL